MATMRRGSVFSRIAEELGGRRVLVSGFGRWGGGVYDLTHGTPVALDDVPTSGLCVGGERLWRVLRAPGEQTTSCELLSYDRRGVRSYQRIDAVRDPHDVCWFEGAAHVTSSWDATIWRIEPDGVPRALWGNTPGPEATAVPDSWHVNSLVVVDGSLHVCAFGRFDRHKAWKGSAGRGTGFVHEVAGGVDVLVGIDHPHTPRYSGGRWYVCESTRGLLTELDTDGRRLRHVAIHRFSRGLDIVGRWALVGGNAHRDSEDDRAEIAVVDLATFEVVESVTMPCLEVYDIVAAPVALARGLAIGFGANPSRAVEQHRRQERAADRQPTPDDVSLRLVADATAATLAAAGQGLDQAVTGSCALYGQLPPRMRPGEVRQVTVTVDNGSRLPLATVTPRPLRVGARWSRHDHDRALRNPLAALPELLHPGERVAVDIILEAPDAPGDYEVVVGLHQTGTGWFAETHPTTVIVVPTPATMAAPAPT